MTTESSFPTDSSISGTVVPVFPLPNLYLFPGAVIPLHVFEQRYRQMVDDMLDGPGRLVLATVTEEHSNELAGAPPLYPVAGLGEIGRHERLPDGRYLILVVGLQRVTIEEVESNREYRKVEVSSLPETAAPEDVEVELRPQILEALHSRGATTSQPIEKLPFGQLTDLLLLQLKLPQPRTLELYSEQDVEKRARGCLEQADQ